MSIVVGQVSLIENDPEEQSRNVFRIFLFPSYNSEIKLHDIAMLEVIDSSFNMNNAMKNLFNS